MSKSKSLTSNLLRAMAATKRKTKRNLNSTSVSHTRYYFFGIFLFFTYVFYSYMLKSIRGNVSGSFSLPSIKENLNQINEDQFKELSMHIPRNFGSKTQMAKSTKPPKSSFSFYKTSKSVPELPAGAPREDAEILLAPATKTPAPVAQQAASLAPQAAVVQSQQPLAVQQAAVPQPPAAAQPAAPQLVVSEALPAEADPVAANPPIPESVKNSSPDAHHDMSDYGDPAFQAKHQAHKSMTDTINNYNFPATPPNPDFYFHNKMPKCGSTTMQKLLKMLEKKNGFKLYNIYVPGSTHNDQEVLNALTAADSAPTTPGQTGIILKHHTFMNFTQFGKAQPTYLNVVRDPIDRFASEYYFCRNGWGKKPDYKGVPCQNMTQDQLSMTLDQCISQNLPECTQNHEFTYISWLCGNHPICHYQDNDLAAKAQAVEYTKNIVLHEYFAIGILEDFKETLQLFEKLMPKIFTGVSNLYESDAQVKTIVDQTKTLNRYGISEANRKYLQENLFKYEVDLYNFIHVKFLKQLEKFVHSESLA